MSKLILLFSILICSYGNGQITKASFVPCINSQNGVITMTIKQIEKGTITVQLRKDKTIYKKYDVIEFAFKCSGRNTITVKGNKLDATAIRALSKMQYGDQITISGIKMKDGPEGGCNKMGVILINVR